MRILMLSHVDARWIKQRPHFLAEALHDAGHDVLFAYARAYDRTRLQDTDLSCPAHALLTMPNRLRRGVLLISIDSVIQVAWAVVLRMRLRPDVVWLTSPRLAVAARFLQRWGRVRLVYDYMDRNALFDDVAAGVEDEELRMLRTSDLILCSSSALLADVNGLSQSAPAALVRNALGDPAVWKAARRDPHARPDEIVMGYAGTISSWFDFKLILAALDANPSWRLRLWGPADVPVPGHPRLLVEGVVAHRDLPDHLAECDVLVMPFALTPLIKAVDPVKAYEYVATGLAVVLPQYPETDHFEPMAQRYLAGDVGSFVDAVRRSSVNQTPDNARDEFVRANTWHERVAGLQRRLEKLR